MALKCCLLLQNQSIWSKKRDKTFFAIYFSLPDWVALPPNGLLKHGDDEAAADRSQGPRSVNLSCVLVKISSFLIVFFNMLIQSMQKPI